MDQDPAQRGSTANATSETRRGRENWFLMIVVAGLALSVLFIGAKDFYGFFGTPTRATVTYCDNGNPNKGTWSIAGASQTGVMAPGFFDSCSVGSSLDVRVSNGIGYTASSWLVGFVMGGGFLVGLIVLFVRGRPRNGR